MPSPKIRKRFTKLKTAIVALRKRGKTYGEIRKVYNIPKSTISLWLKKVKIPPRALKEMRKRVYEKWREWNQLYSEMRSRKAAEIRERHVNEASKEILSLSENDLKLIGAALYWAEGGKKNRNQLRFSNSDPEIIRIIMRFFQGICDIPNEKIKARVHIYPDTDYQKTLDFWSNIAGLPKTNFHPPQTQMSRASRYKRPRNTLPYGTLHLTICDTEAASRVKGWIQGVVEKI